MADDSYEAFHENFPGGFTLRDEANAIVAMAFRNGPIEALHAGKDSELLHNPDLCRITQEEMKAIMINACRMMEKLLREKQDDPVAYQARMKQCAMDHCQRWER